MIELTTLLQSVGFDVVVLETVGVGQSEVEVASLAETTIVVLVPEAGDEVQMMKSGLMEVADLFVVNKSDRPDAQVFTNHIQQMLMEAAHDTESIKVVKTVASQGVGIQELITAINEHHKSLSNAGGDAKLIMSKVLQLIVAQKMRQIDLKEMNEKLLAAYAKPQFNIFKFAQSFY
jgi:LAO/AO transport system kinase